MSDTYPADAVRARIDAALRGAKHPKRHPLEVTADRIADVIDRYGDRLTGAEKDDLSNARTIIEGLMDGA